MGHRVLSFKLPTDFSAEELERRIARELRTKDFSHQIENQSLDARKKDNIHWLVQVSVSSKAIKGPPPEPAPELEIPRASRGGRALVVGSGPAGFFAALALRRAGLEVTLVERGAEVARRAEGIRGFEAGGPFDPLGNYAFGEGGAGTFSDGKLTSRTKGLSLEKRFILSSYVRAGAPAEILHLAHPHLGSDNLRRIVKNLRGELLGLGGNVLFQTTVTGLRAADGKVTSAVTSAGDIEADHFLFAPGHSAHDTYRMLMQAGVRFRVKPFAIGCRVEHPQTLVNLAQWGRGSLPGVKAAEYRLTSDGGGALPVYSFCMCPGGMVVPAAPRADANIVNGMSRYRRDGEFANAACVAAVELNSLLGRELSPEEALAWLEGLEHSFFDYAQGYRAPACGVRDFIERREPSAAARTSYPFGLLPAPLWELLPDTVGQALAAGMKDFSGKLKGFETGMVMGLESKTSSPIQVVRGLDGRCEGFENLYLAGEGAGFSGGIVSSAADGLKAALRVISA